VTIGDLSQLKTDLLQLLWQTDLDQLSRSKALAIRVARMAFVLLRDVSQGQLTLRAMSLVYTTLLSLVPLLALSFSVLKAFGVHNLVTPLLLNLFEPLGEKGVELANQIVGFVENVGVGVLGTVGLVMLVYTVVSLIQKVEEAFNFIWHVSTLRRLAHRLSGYLSVVMIGPLLLVTAMGITATVTSTSLVQQLLAIEPFGSLFYWLGKVVPYLLVIGAFTAVYMIIPNTHVRFLSALMGGTVAGVLWESMGWAFASFIVSSAKYEAVYSGFAIVILFLFWIYINWLILLVGASISFYHQNPAYQRPDSTDRPLGYRTRMVLALEVMRLIGEAHQQQAPRWTLESLSTALTLPVQFIDGIVQALHERSLLVRTDDEPPLLMPGRDLAAISIKDIFDAVGGEDASRDILATADSHVRQVMQEFDDLAQAHFGPQAIKTLLLSEPKAGD
jgi:membrane protein